MSAKLVIGSKNYSSWSLRAWLMARKTGLEFVEEQLPLDTPEFEQRIATSAFHYAKIEACREDGFPTGHDHNSAIGFSPIERLIYLAKDLRRKHVSPAVVDSNGGDIVLQVVLDGFSRHQSRPHW